MTKEDEEEKKMPSNFSTWRLAERPMRAVT